MRNKITYILLATLLAIQSCALDKGNYDYHQVNQVNISSEEFENRIYEVNVGVDNLEISPKITFTLDQDAATYSYQWVAVAQAPNQGERTTLSESRDLSWKADIEIGSYDLYLKVKDNNTGLIFSSQPASLQVRTLTTMGFLLAGEDDTQRGEIDMLALSKSGSAEPIYSTLHLDDELEMAPIELVWVNNNEYAADDRLYISTQNGAYRLSRKNFSGDQTSSIAYSFLNDDYVSAANIMNIERIADKRKVAIIDNYIYDISISSNNSAGLFENPANRVEGEYEYFKVSEQMAFNIMQPDVKIYAFYSLEDQSFYYLPNFGDYLVKLNDGDSDQYSWQTTNDFPNGGLELVAIVNSLFANGQSAAIMENPSDHKFYIYTFTCNRSGTVGKGQKYSVKSDAPMSSNSKFIMTSRFGHLIFAEGNTLYAYDFRQSGSVKEIAQVDGEITTIYNDMDSPQAAEDQFYVATYQAGLPRGGKLYKYSVENNPNDIIVNKDGEWSGFIKINDIYYKNF